MVGTADDRHKKRLHRLEVLDFIERLAKQRDIFSAHSFFDPLEGCIADQDRFFGSVHGMASFAQVQEVGMAEVLALTGKMRTLYRRGCYVEFYPIVLSTMRTASFWERKNHPKDDAILVVAPERFSGDRSVFFPRFSWTVPENALSARCLLINILQNKDAQALFLCTIISITSD